MDKNKGKYFFTSESVTEGHPDKIADQCSDAILDKIIEQDEKARVACETLVSTGMVIITGEITTDAYVNIPQVVRDTIKDIGYTEPHYGFDYETTAVLTSIDEQSPDIARGVTQKHLNQGAGDQGMMFGYAVDETPTYMPMPIYLAHKLTKKLADVRKNKKLEFLRPDGKSQVTIEYEGLTPKKVNTVVLSAQHEDTIDHYNLKHQLINHVIAPVLEKECSYKDIDIENVKYHINPTGRFVEGGPKADAGLTGRKIIVDTFGGFGAHGGGAFSGKDPSKVDRTGTYAARYVAKNIVAAGLAKKVSVQVAYAIGVAEPVSIYINQFGTGKYPDEKIAKAVKKAFDFRPGAIIDRLELRRPIYKKTAAYGHFGRELPEFNWEKTDLKKDILNNI
ncbi:MAG: methionine adenosyltransferase [Candidatus Mcinerneyibacterium aminivorans]|uniref:S-adenosylmethionine synthase n=1 Tax=Candidatus Mcinerneyibacterium aminivorans TaxID=2703815 RepID=A0A5D0MFG7_9BACT|nr:MAG: methionine adenosyltransferase [Candidatus Mcinerneyibacterium aminivorans]